MENLTPSAAETHSTRVRPLDSEEVEHAEEQGHTAAGIIVSGGVVAVAGMAAAHDNLRRRRAGRRGV